MDKKAHVVNAEFWVYECARCGESHNVEFFHFSNDPVEIGGVPFYYWGECPVTSDPLFMNFTYTIVLENDQEDEE